MPPREALETLHPITKSQLTHDLAELGVQPRGIVMVHCRMSAIGWVVGGTETVINAFLEVLGSGGTLMAYAGWEDNPSRFAEWPEVWRDAYQAEMPPFDTATSAATHTVGRIPERIRTWPGSHRSQHPEANVVAIGRRAEWLTSTHPMKDAHGRGGPLSKLADSGGQVLMLGAPFNTMTVLHHAEAIAQASPKRWVTYRMPIRIGDKIIWEEFADVDTVRGVFPYEQVIETGQHPFTVIATSALSVGIGTRGRVGFADAHLFPVQALIRFATDWIENRFPLDSASDLSHKA